MRVSGKGQVTIPRAVRDRLGIVPGSEVDFVEREGSIVLETQTAELSGDVMSFEEWASSVAGTIDTMGMTTNEYMDWLRGPREDLDTR